MIDKPLKLATCPRCQAYVLAGQVSGLRTAVDPGPVTLDAYRAALLAGKRVFTLAEQAGRPFKLHDITPRTPLAGKKLMAEHGCASRSARPVEFQEIPQGPQSAPVRPGRPKGGLHPRPVRETASQGRLAALRPVRIASRRLSDYRYLYRRCEACGQLIGGADRYGVEYKNQWVYVWHTECPSKGEVNAQS